MAIQVDVYTNDGMATGLYTADGGLRERLEAGDPLVLHGVTAETLADLRPTIHDTLSFVPDEILVAVTHDPSLVPVHAAWHALRLEAGPYVVEGELPTLPGFDPGRALTRPGGEFVLLRDLRLSLLGRPERGVVTAEHALVNRYTVDRIAADLMLGFFFPGAVIESTTSAGASVPA
jgi:hypothetical protein